MYIGSIPLEIIIQTSSAAYEDDSKGFLNIVEKAVGRPVTMIQAVSSVVIALAGFFVSGSLLYGAIRGSFLSIGRNPLSTQSIYKGMIRASIISLVVLLASLIFGWVVLAL